MTVTSKALLRRSLTYTKLLDTDAVGPYVGIHLGDPGRVHLRRTSASGYVETDSAPAFNDPGWAYASLAHMLDCLGYIDSEAVDVFRLNTGSLMLRTVNAAFESELRVHTVSHANSGFKLHTLGGFFSATDVSWLRHLDVKPFPLAMPPTMIGNQLALVTSCGTVYWETEDNPGWPSSPRESFLRALSDVDNGSFTLTDLGYFAVGYHDMVFVIAGHNTTTHQAVPTLNGAQRLATVQAGRMVQALQNIGSLAQEGTPITVTPRGGLIGRNKYSQPVRFGLGDLSPFFPFDIYPRSAKLIADALGQTPGDEIHIHSVPGITGRVLFSRGTCIVAIQASPSGSV